MARSGGGTSSVTPSRPTHNPGDPTNSGVLFNQFVTAPPDDLPVSDYRLAPAVGVRVVGGLLVVVAVLVFLTTVAVGLFELPAGLLLAVAVLGVAVVVGGGYVVTQRVAVVRLGPDGYRVRLIRGVGVTAAGWTEVEEAVTTTAAAGDPVVLLRLKGGPDHDDPGAGAGRRPRGLRARPAGAPAARPGRTSALSAPGRT